MKQKFKWKVFISISLFFSFFIIFFSGIILYLSPPGRIANWSDWNIIGLTKSEWQALHTVFSYTFAVSSIFHLFTVNWKAFWSYIKLKSKKGLNRKTEVISGTAFMIIFFIGTRASVPPFSTIVDFGETLTHSWENKKKEIAPPIPHTETYTLEKLANSILNKPLEEIVTTLEKNGYKVENTSVTLADIGKEYNVSPQTLYNLLTDHSGSGSKNSGEHLRGEGRNRTETVEHEDVHIEDEHGQTGQGKGYGRMTVEDVANELNVDASELIQKLKSHNINAKKTETLRTISTEAGTTPRDIYDILSK